MQPNGYRVRSVAAPQDLSNISAEHAQSYEKMTQMEASNSELDLVAVLSDSPYAIPYVCWIDSEGRGSALRARA